jgi:hypothetical protein
MLSNIIDSLLFMKNLDVIYFHAYYIDMGFLENYFIHIVQYNKILLIYLLILNQIQNFIWPIKPNISIR